MFNLAWRNLSQNRTQFLLGVGGVALALLLMLTLDALLAGSEEDLVAYIEQSDADIFVAQAGVKNMHMAASAITWRDLRLAEHNAEVISASPILYTTSVVNAGDSDVLSYIIGFDPDEPLGGPGEVAVGTAVGVARAATGLPGGAAGGAPGPAALQPASRRKTTSGKATAFGQVNDRPIRLRIAGKLS